MAATSWRAGECGVARAEAAARGRRSRRTAGRTVRLVGLRTPARGRARGWASTRPRRTCGAGVSSIAGRRTTRNHSATCA
eukprot:scaffold7382_cov406-Prasinococcus_capsulatus_cf.AAC.22